MKEKLRPAIEIDKEPPSLNVPKQPGHQGLQALLVSVFTLLIRTQDHLDSMASPKSTKRASYSGQSTARLVPLPIRRQGT
jgi:hypothetical protein